MTKSANKRECLSGVHGFRRSEFIAMMVGNMTAGGNTGTVPVAESLHLRIATTS